MRTRTGRRIKVTGYHSLFTLDGSGIAEVKTSDLKPNESQIAVTAKMISFDFPVNEKEFTKQLSKGAFNVSWDTVISVTKVEDAEYVYDISVDPCQNFAGGFGGIFAHNSEKNLAEVFDIARKKAPFMLFFDEIDSIGKRGTPTRPTTSRPA